MNDNSIENLLSEVKKIISIHQENANKQGEKFNIFSILRMERREVKTHSNFIYELLNPKGSHGQGEIFLQRFAEIVLNSEVPNTVKNPQQEALTAENRRIDFTLETDLNIIGIEMKIDAGDSEHQLWDYQQELIKEAKDKKGTKLLGTRLFYLTLDGSEASEYSYKKDGEAVEYECISFESHILKWIEDCIKQSAEKSVLREALIQYKILIEKITGQNKDITMEIAKLIKDKESFQVAQAIEDGLIQAKANFQVQFWEELMKKLDADKFQFTSTYYETLKIKEFCKKYYEKGNKKDCYGIEYKFDNKEYQLILMVEYRVYFCLKLKNNNKYIYNVIKKADVLKSKCGLYWPNLENKLNFKEFNDELIDMLSGDQREITIKALAKEFKELVEELEKNQ